VALSVAICEIKVTGDLPLSIFKRSLGRSAIYRYHWPFAIVSNSLEQHTVHTGKPNALLTNESGALLPYWLLWATDVNR